MRVRNCSGCIKPFHEGDLIEAGGQEEACEFR